MDDRHPDDMTEAEWREDFARAILKRDRAGCEALRLARTACRESPEQVLAGLGDHIEIGPDGTPRVLTDPGYDPRFEFVAAQVSARFLADRYLSRGQDAAAVRRRVMSIARHLRAAWQGSESDKSRRLVAYRRGIREALEGVH
jgi:hypothetical protein